MDGLLKEAQYSKSASAKPGKTQIITSSGRESSFHPSGDVQPGTTTKATVTGAARPPSATHRKNQRDRRVRPCRAKP